ncbi:MAG: S-methyl-5-thioribose-1-phosphate isomerase [Verrucomicrobiota bacterium]
MSAKLIDFKTIRYHEGIVEILDQTLLPHSETYCTLRTLEEVAVAIEKMQVRGAPLIGVTAAYGVVLAMQQDASDAALGVAINRLSHTRPTAVNLHWALQSMRDVLDLIPAEARLKAAQDRADAIFSQEVTVTEEIGMHGLALLRSMSAALPVPRELRVMTHCNPGKLGTPGLGTATAPLYLAQQEGLAVHVWVSETRPRWQGALTAWELSRSGVPHTVMVDNAAGHLLQRGLVDVVIVGADRITRRGDTANKIGTYLKAVAAEAHGVPFYVAVAGNTIDFTLNDGVAEIPIEQRTEQEVLHAGNYSPFPVGTQARNDAFDVTPSSLITGFITERGILKPEELERNFNPKP